MRDVVLTNDDQIEVMVGTLLGDAYLDKTTMGYSLRLHHSMEQKEYVFWKYEVLRNIINSAPKSYFREQGFGEMVYFRTVSHPYLITLRNKFYKGRVKIFPKKLVEKFLLPLALAVWIMDDGTNELGYGKCLRINTQSFSREEQICICKLLNKKYGLIATLNKDKKRYRIRFAKECMGKLIGLVRPYILPSMFYKLVPVTTGTHQ